MEVLGVVFSVVVPTSSGAYHRGVGSGFLCAGPNILRGVSSWCREWHGQLRAGPVLGGPAVVYHLGGPAVI